MGRDRVVHDLEAGGCGDLVITCVFPGRSPRRETSPARRSSPKGERPGALAPLRPPEPAVTGMRNDRALQDAVIAPRRCTVSRFAQPVTRAGRASTEKWTIRS